MNYVRAIVARTTFRGAVVSEPPTLFSDWGVSPAPPIGLASCVRAGRPLPQMPFEFADELVEQVVGLVNEANQDVCDHLGRPCFDIGLIGRIGHILLRPEFADE